MKHLKLIAVTAIAFGLTACNTIGGIGEDIQAGGKGLTHVANKVQGKDTKKDDSK